MTGFPGPRPMHGDAVQINTDTTTMTITGAIMSRGVLRDGRGYLELTLPKVDPQQRGDLERCERYVYELHLDSARVYASPFLVLRETVSAEDGSLTLTGSP